jgi:hypothetical protein
MQAFLFPLPPRPNNPGPDPKFDVVIVYEDIACGIEAMNLYQHLDKCRNPGFEFNLNIWRFDVLALPTIADMAASQAADADAVIVAIRGALPLPPAAMLWLKKWTESNPSGQNGAVVALYDRLIGNEDEVDSAPSVLRTAAEMTGRQYFARQSDFATREGDPGLDRLRLSADAAIPMLRHMMTEIEPVQHWGLNE